MPYATPELRRAHRRMPHVKEADRRRRSTPEYLARKAERRRERLQADPAFAERERTLGRLRWQRPGYRATQLSPATLAARSANRTATLRGVAGRLIPQDVTALWERQPTCLNCGQGRGLDHIVPMGIGGPNTPSNIQNLCLPCNQSKHMSELAPGQIPVPPRVATATHCRWDHERAEHMRQSPSGHRYCGACHAKTVRRYKARQEGTVR